MNEIVLVEDNPDWLELCCDRLKKELSRDPVVIGSESDFIENMPEFEKHPPQLFIIDVMVPWSEPRPDIPEASEEVKRNGFFKAGFRCQKRLAENENLRNAPIIFWTILSDKDVLRALRTYPLNVSHVAKDLDLNPLMNKIRELL